MKNKNFYYIKKLIKHSKMYGHNTYELYVYQCKQNKMEFLGTTRQCTASTCGDKGEIWGFLQSQGIAPKKIDIFSDMYTYIKNNNINIIQLGDE